MSFTTSPHQVARVVTCLAVALTCATAAHAQRAQAGAAPQPYVDVLQVPAGEACAFPIELASEGKLKDVVLKGGTRIVSFTPKIQNVATNLAEPDKKVSFHSGGAFHITPGADGSATLRLTGHVFLIGGNWGFTLLVGNHTVSFDAYGNSQGPVGDGRSVDVCALIQ